MSDNFDRLLARTERRDRQSRDACPDADVLAAYLDGTLASTERGMVETHAADCPRCALQLATIVRLEDETREPRRTPAVLPWRRFLWTVPVATAALAAILYVAVPSRPPEPAQTIEVRSAPASEAPVSQPAAAAPSPAASSSPQVVVDEARTAERAPVPARKVQASPAAPAPPAAENSLRKEAFAAAGPQAPASVHQTTAPPAVASQDLRQAHEMPTGSDAALAAEPKPEAGARAKAADLVAPAAPSASPGPPQAKDRIARADADASDELKEERDARARTGNAAVPAPIGRVVAREGSSIAPLSEQVTTAAGLVVHAPDARVKWRVMASRIERSVDGGLTWAVESSPAAADLKMGAAPSASVCWLASPAGQVLRRAETGVWADVSPAPRVAVATLAVSNAASAVIASPDGTRLRTTDAGRTWVADTER